PGSAPLLPPRWRPRKADWELYNSFCDEHFFPIVGEVEDLLASLGGLDPAGRQSAMDQIAELLKGAFIAVAKRCVPVAASVRKTSALRGKFNDLLIAKHSASNRLRRLKLKVRADTDAGLVSVLALRRRGLLVKLKASMVTTALRLKVLKEELQQSEWA